MLRVSSVSLRGFGGWWEEGLVEEAGVSNDRGFPSLARAFHSRNGVFFTGEAGREEIDCEEIDCWEVEAIAGTQSLTGCVFSTCSTSGYTTRRAHLAWTRRISRGQLAKGRRDGSGREGRRGRRLKRKLSYRKVQRPVLLSKRRPLT